MNTQRIFSATASAARVHPGAPRGGIVGSSKGTTRRRTLAALGAALLLCGAAFAMPQGGTIAGTVVDPDGSGLPGVLVTVSGDGVRGVSVVTGHGGVFRLAALAPGSYQVRAELEGLEPPSPQSATVRSGEVVTLRLAFSKPRFHEITEVTARHDVVPVTELRESAARDVGEAVDSFPGVTKVRKGGIANDIVLRGLQRDNINVLIDGARVYGACPNRMDVPAFHVDFSEIDHVEVTKGPFDIENQGSLGGVVNIVTRQPEPGMHGAASLAAGSDGYVNPSVNASWGGPSFAALAGYSYRSADPYRDGDGRRFTEVANYLPGEAATTAFRVNTAWARVFRAVGSQTFDLSYTRQEATHVLYPTLQMDAAWDNADRLEAGWQKTDVSAAVARVRVRTYATRVRHWMTDELRMTGLGTTRGWSMGTMADTSAVGLKADADVAGFRVGFEALHRGWNAATQMAKMGYMSQASIPDVVTTSGGVFVSTHRDLSRTVALDLGARLDHARTAADAGLANTDLYFAYLSTRSTEHTDTLPSATARLSWAVSPSLTVVGGIGRTVRFADPTERFFALKRAGSDWVGYPDLKPVRNTGADLQATWTHGRGAVTASAYYESLADWITVHNQTRVNMVKGVMNTAAKSYANVDATIRGAELNVTHAVTEHAFVAGGLSWTRGDKRPDPSRLIFSRNMAEIPPVSGRLALRWDTGKLFAEAEGVAAAAQDRVDTDLQERRAPGWAVLNVKLGGDVLGLRVQGAVTNVFNRQYQEYLSSVRDPYRSGVYVSEPGRSWSVTVVRRF